MENSIQSLVTMRSSQTETRSETETHKIGSQDVSHDWDHVSRLHHWCSSHITTKQRNFHLLLLHVKPQRWQRNDYSHMCSSTCNLHSIFSSKVPRRKIDKPSTHSSIFMLESLSLSNALKTNEKHIREEEQEQEKETGDRRSHFNIDFHWILMQIRKYRFACQKMQKPLNISGMLRRCSCKV